MRRLLLPFTFLLFSVLLMSEKKAPGRTSKRNGPLLVFDEMKFDFGTLQQGDQVDHEFKFTNKGNAPLVIIEAATACGCDYGEFPREPVAPGKSGILKYHFNSAGKIGPQTKSVTVASNSIDTASTQIPNDVNSGKTEQRTTQVLLITGKVEARPTDKPFPSGNFSEQR